jgi:hypothetical protein
MSLNPKIGDSLWCVMSNRGGQHITTVTKVGSKWIYFDNGHRRCDFNGKIDGGKYSSPGTCYPSKETYVAELALTDAWNRFRSKVGGMWSIPKDVTIENIQKANDLLFRKP